MQVTRVGDNLGVLLPASVVDALKLHEGVEVEVSVSLKPSAENEETRRKSIEQHLIALRRFRGLLPVAEFRFDREEANARR